MKDDVLAAEAVAGILGLGKEQVGRRYPGLKPSFVLSRLWLPALPFLCLML